MSLVSGSSEPLSCSSCSFAITKACNADQSECCSLMLPASLTPAHLALSNTPDRPAYVLFVAVRVIVPFGEWRAHSCFVVRGEHGVGAGQGISLVEHAGEAVAHAVLVKAVTYVHICQ